jgi:hypothetical protein
LCGVFLLVVTSTRTSQTQAAQSPPQFMISWLENHLIPCFIKSHFGFDCPGCGMQRALIALLKGDLLQSLHYHPALIPLILSIIVLIIQLKLKHPKGEFLIKWMFAGTIGIMLVNFGSKFF